MRLSLAYMQLRPRYCFNRPLSKQLEPFYDAKERQTQCGKEFIEVVT